MTYRQVPGYIIGMTQMTWIHTVDGSTVSGEMMDRLPEPYVRRAV